MANDDSYELTSHREITDLKKQLQELRTRIDKVSPKELIESMNVLAKSIDSMLKLFKEAVEELKFEDREEALSGKDSVNEKLDQIIEQNKIIADGIVAVTEMLEELNKKKAPATKPRPSFQPPIQEPGFQQPPDIEPSSQPSEFEPQFDEPGPRQGPVAMPSIPFSDLDLEEPKPRKKGLFGRLKR